MDTPDRERAAAQLIRVCKPDGKIGLAIGRRWGSLTSSSTTGVKSPALWGTLERIKELFGRHASSIGAGTHNFVFRYRSPEHWLEVFKTYYGPLLKAFTALEPAAQSALANDLRALIGRFDRSGDASVVAPSEYLEIVMSRQ
jgi:hypothetical protein